MSVQQLLNATIKMIFLYLYERRLLGKKSNFHVLVFSVLSMSSFDYVLFAYLLFVMEIELSGVQFGLLSYE